jgi:flagellar hook-associated protein 3 FlgL
MANTQIQLASGLKSPTFKGIASETQRLLNVERNYTALKNYNMNSTIVGGNVDIAYNAVKSIIDLGNNFLQTLTSAMNGNLGDPQVTKNQADILIKEVAGLLNTSSGGRYLFAGSKIDTPPVDLSDPAFTPATVPSTPNTAYYQGDSTVLSTQVSETLTLNYGFKADDPAFEKLIRCLNIAYNNPSNQAAIVEAEGLLQDSIDGMANVFSQMSTYARTIENQSQRNEEDMSVMNNLVGSLKGIDIAAVTVRQKELETQIEASYASSVKILNLKLTDYI